MRKFFSAFRPSELSSKQFIYRGSRISRRRGISFYIATVLVSLGFLSSASAGERWSYIYGGQSYSSLSAAKAALRAGNDAILVSQSGGSTKKTSNGYVHTYNFNVLKGYKFHTGLNGFGWNGNETVYPSIGEVVSNVLSRSTRNCEIGPGYSPNVLSMSTVGEYDQSTRRIDVEYTRTSFGYDCDGSLGTVENDNGDFIQGHYVSDSVTATLTQYCEETRGNPCEPITGSKRESESDYKGNGLHFSRFYNSSRQDVSNLYSNAYLPPGWSHSYSRRVWNSNADDVFFLVRDNGDRIVLEETSDSHFANGKWLATSTDERPGSGHVEWKVVRPDGTAEYYGRATAVGKLLAVVDPAGLTTTFSYEGNYGHLLSGVTGPFGHELKLHNNGYRLTSITLPNSDVIAYGYDDATGFLLTSVTYPDGLSKTYHYEDTVDSDLLTGITQEDGTRFSAFEYDARGRVTKSAHAYGIETVLQYNADGSTTVTSGNGLVETFYVSQNTTQAKVSNITDT